MLVFAHKQAGFTSSSPLSSTSLHSVPLTIHNAPFFLFCQVFFAFFSPFQAGKEKKAR
jgi:hypothetical protein